MKIGVFDSGLGGLTVLRSVIERLPQYDYVYYGDTKNLPYGEKPEAEILELTQAALEYLFQRECKLVIVACNTASSETLRKLQDTFVNESYPDRRVLGVIVPTMEVLAEINPTSATLLATTRTIESGKYQLELSKLDSHTELKSCAAPELVPLIEDNKLQEALNLALNYIEGQTTGEGEVVILGCTHYSVLKERLRAVLPKTQILSQDEIIPDKLAHYLVVHPEIEVTLSRANQREIHLTAIREEYSTILSEWDLDVPIARESP